MIVCQCRRVTDRKVAACVQRGCSSLRDLCAATGAGQECGCCVRRLKELIEQQLKPEAAHATA